MSLRPFYYLNPLLFSHFVPSTKLEFISRFRILQPPCSDPASSSCLVVQFLQESVKQNILHSSLACELDTELQASHQKWTRADEIFDFSKENINILLRWSCSPHLVNQSSIIESVCLSDTESYVPRAFFDVHSLCWRVETANTAHTAHELYTWAIKHVGEGLQTELIKRRLAKADERAVGYNQTFHWSSKCCSI